MKERSSLSSIFQGHTRYNTSPFSGSIETSCGTQKYLPYISKIQTLLVSNFCPDSPAAMFSVILREVLV